MDVCLGPATVWQRCSLIFDLLSICTVCSPPSLLPGALIDEARFAELWESSLGARLSACACVCKKIKNHVESPVGNNFPNLSVHELKQNARTDTDFRYLCGPIGSWALIANLKSNETETASLLMT